MKELSIEEKAKAYDSIFERLKEMYNNNKTNVAAKLVYERYFPELAESEDERIRKQLFEMVHDTTGDSLWIDYNVHKEDALAWLEKQGEHAKFRDSIQVGDKVTRNEDGVLVNLSQLKRVAKKDEKQGEQKPSIEMITPEESLGISSEEYNKIVDECIYGEQKPAWSEEDEIALGDALWCCKQAASIAKDENDMGNIWYAETWLKTLKDRVQPQPKHEWSEEDKEFLELTLSNLAELKDRYGEGYGRVGKCIDWLKSLQPQPIDVEAAIAYQEGYQKALVEFSQKHQEWTEDDINMIDWLIRCCEKEYEELCNDRYGHQEIVSDLKRDCRKKWDWLESLKNRVAPQKQWKPSDEHYELEEFAKIVRGNLTGISKTVQNLFEAKYLQLTGKKMYGGFKD